MTSSIILRPGRSGKVHHPRHHDLDNISDGNSINTQAATSLQSGPFQYVNSNLLEQAAQASFLSDVSSMAADSMTENVYILRRLDPVVVILDGQGNIIGQWTSAQTGIQAGHSIKLKWSGSVPQLSVWVVDLAASCISIFSPTGQIIDRLGPQIGNITFGKITDIAWNENADTVYVTDGDAGGQYNRVVVYSLISGALAIWGGTAPGSGPGQFDLPHAVAVDALSRVWVVDSMNSRIQIYSAAGEILPESPWVFPGLKLYGIAISSATRDLESNTAMVYITGNSMSDPTGTTGQLMLVPASMDPTNPAALGSGAILTSWSIPSMLHNVTSTETPVNQLLLSTLSTIPAQPAQAFQQSTARPLMAQNQSSSPPVWPTKFTANLLLHPFNWGDLPQVAQVTYSAGAFIQFDVFTLAGMQSSFLFTQMPSSVQMWYRVSNNLPWQGPFATSMTIPPCDWLVSKTTYQGDAPILQINNSWWCEQLQDTNTTTNWHWFRTDTNVPFRTMNSTNANPNNIPILGEYSFIYWTNFTSSNSLPSLEKKLEEVHLVPATGDSKHDLAKLQPLKAPSFMAALDNLIGQDTCPLTPAERSSNIETIQGLIPGLQPGSDGLPLPTWPNVFYMTCIMTPVNRRIPMSTEVLYSWPTVELRTRMFNADQQSTVDAVENNVGTYQINRFANGSCSTFGDPLPGLGPPQPAWATAGGGSIVATITNNPDLSPNSITRIFREQMDDTRQFWIWYSNYDPNIIDTPVVFMETAPPASEGTSLALADYKVMELTPLVDQISFTVSPPFPSNN